MKAVVLAPWRPGSAEREALWRYVQGWWSEQFPDLTIYTAPGPEGPFNRAAAINVAAELAGEWDVALVVDTDSIPEARNVTAAIATAAGSGAMVVAHTRRHMLTKQATTKILAGRGVGSWSSRSNASQTFTDSVSCCVAVSRKLWDDVRGFDPLFVGWGREDTAFRIACEAMSGLPIACLDGESWHLFHSPPAEVKQSHPLRKANEARHQRYVEARWNPDAVRVLIDERDAAPSDLGDTQIPRILHRTLPEAIDPQVEVWWDQFRAMHPGWDLRTYREPIDPEDWPLTGDLFRRCQNGAQKAGLIRLEALFTYGGVYVDSDVEPIRSLEPLLHVPAFAAWEDETTVPDAVLGAKAGHPAWEAMLDQAKAAVKAGKDAWTSGPGVTTRNLPNRPDVLVLPPGAFYPHHYLEKNQAGQKVGQWTFCEHKWHHSWGSEAQKRSIAERQR